MRVVPGPEVELRGLVQLPRKGAGDQVLCVFGAGVQGHAGTACALDVAHFYGGAGPALAAAAAGTVREWRLGGEGVGGHADIPSVANAEAGKGAPV